MGSTSPRDSLFSSEVLGGERRPRKPERSRRAQTGRARQLNNELDQGIRAAPTLQRYVPVLLRRILVAFGLEHLQRLDQLLARFPWLDDRIEEASVGGHVGI